VQTQQRLTKQRERGTLRTQVYTASLVLTNNLKGSVEASVRPSASDRLTVVPASFRLGPGESTELSVKLRVLRFGNKAKAVDQGQRDVLHIKVVSLCMLHARLHGV
jgi:hypothetical protein